MRLCASCRKRERSSSGYDEDREASAAEQLAWHAAEMQMRVLRATDDDEVGPAGLCQDLDLCTDLARAACEVPADVCLEQLFGDIAGKALVTLAVDEQRDRREEPADGCCPGQVRDKTGVDTSLFA